MTFRLGEWRIDTGARRISRGLVPIHLTKKAFELLVLLLQQRPNVVTKEDIHRLLWPDTFVAESSLQALVSEIRQAMDDGAGRQAWIRTVHGVGYAWSAEVEEVPLASSETREPRAWLLAESLRVPLHDGENVVGRGSGTDLVQIDAAGISRRHARITLSSGATIEDLDSKNGTWLRDQRVTARMAVADGDTIRLGSLLLTFRLCRDLDSTDTLGPPAF